MVAASSFSEMNTPDSKLFVTERSMEDATHPDEEFRQNILVQPNEDESLQLARQQRYNKFIQLLRVFLSGWMFQSFG